METRNLKKTLWREAYHWVGKAGAALQPVEECVVARLDGSGSRPLTERSLKPVAGHTLYHFQLSPYSYRVRRALRRLNLAIPMHDVLVDQEAFRELVKQGGKDQVPCLRIESPEGTRWMYESRDIVRYLEQL